MMHTRNRWLSRVRELCLATPSCRPEKVGTLHAEKMQLEMAGRTVVDGSDADFEAFLRRLDSAGLHSNSVGLFSAHQMGTNRMGTSSVGVASHFCVARPTTSACFPRFQLANLVPCVW
jgi:hypothetical protein